MLKIVVLAAALALVSCQSSSPAPDEGESSRSVSASEAAEYEKQPAEGSKEPHQGKQFASGLAPSGELADAWGIGAAYSGRVRMSGYLRFSWMPYWNEAGDRSPVLVMRFFADSQGAAKLPEGTAGEDATPPVISLYRTRNGKELVDVDPATMRDIIEQDFERVDPRFKSYQEGHIQQPGTLVMDEFLVETVADRPYFHGRFVSFEFEAMDEAADELQERLDDQADAAGPGHGPAYEQSFYFTEPGIVYAEPDVNSDQVAEVEAHEFFIKIRTVDEQWYEVSMQGDEETRGFVRRDALTPVN